MVKPGNPPYLEYVRNSVAQKRDHFKQTTGSDLNAFPDRTKHQYKTREGNEVLESDVHGNPNLVYESLFVEGWEPSGVPVCQRTCQ